MAKTPTQDFFDKAATDPNIAKKSRGWFNKEVVRLRQMRPQPKALMKQAGRSTRLLPGRLYMFQYEAKGADKLPYFDRLDLIMLGGDSGGEGDINAGQFRQKTIVRL